MSSDTAADDWSIYPYDPVKPLPILFAIIMFGIACALIYQSLILYKWRHFGIVMLWASVVWIAGFICRAYSVYHPQNISMFISQYVLILVGPPLYAVSECFILGRLMQYLPYHAPIHPGRVISTVSILGALVETLTANGASNTATADKNISRRNTGLALIEAGLILQSLIEVGFFSLVVVMEFRARRAGHFSKKIQIICRVLYITSFMMLVRCIVRTIEGFETSSCPYVADGPPAYCGYIIKHEWILWVFECANITLFVFILTIFPPGKYLPRSKKVYLDPVDGRTERKGPGFGKADKRSLLLTVVDPFDLRGILTGKGRAVEPFWEEDHPVYHRARTGVK